MKITERINSPTPPFFKKVRNIGLILTGVSAAVIGLPVALPSVIIQIAGYLAVAGTVMSGVSQTTVDAK